MERLREHRWPGNVRELENLVRRLRRSIPRKSSIRRCDRAGAVRKHARRPRRPSEGPANEGMGQAVERHLREYFAAHKDGCRPRSL
jgi:two-component system nitrogen regulation response regulator GlnG